MRKNAHQAQVRSAIDPPFDITVLFVENAEAGLRPVLVLDYGHAAPAWEAFKDWCRKAPTTNHVQYFFAEDGIGFYGVDANNVLKVSIFVRNVVPNYAAFKQLIMRETSLSILAKTHQFGHFELVLSKDVNAFRLVKGILNGELPNVDNTGEDPKAGA